jgi:hypothetical protein
VNTVAGQNTFHSSELVVEDGAGIPKGLPRKRVVA